MSVRKVSLLGPDKIKAERKNLQEFISNLQQNKDAFEVFHSMAEKQRLTSKSPARTFQHDYFENYIKPQRDRQRQKRNS